MNKKRQLDNVKAKMVWSSDKGWHLPPADPYVRRLPSEGGSNRLFVGTDHEIVQTPWYDRGDGGPRVTERVK